MLIINNRFLSVYDYNFLLVIEKIFSVKQPKENKYKLQVTVYIFKAFIRGHIYNSKSKNKNKKINNNPIKNNISNTKTEE